MRKIFLSFCLIAFLFNSQMVVLAADKYTMRQRFGVGGNLFTNKIGLGWFKNWGPTYSNTMHPRTPVYYNEMGVNFMPLFGGYGATNNPPNTDPNNSYCQSVKQTILNSIKDFPNNAYIVIGNEIGQDDARQPEQYAAAFANWKACLKSINSTFKVGIGAVNTFFVLPGKNYSDTSPGAFCNTDLNSSQNTYNGYLYSFGGTSYKRYDGRIYLTKIVDTLKASYPTLLPDFFSIHLYPTCPTYTFESSKAYLREFRTYLKNWGFADRDLIVKEFGVYATSQQPVIDYMNTTVDYLATAKDTNIGNPNDNYRLAQRWAWYVSSQIQTITNPPNEAFLYLYDFSTGNITSTGANYKRLLDKYTNNEVCNVQGFKVNSLFQPDSIFAGLNVTVENFFTSNSNPFVIGVVPNSESVLIAQEKSGYYIKSTNCVNRVNCHSPTDTSIKLGNRRDKVFCPSGQYSDFRWSYYKKGDLNGDTLITVPADILPLIKVLFSISTIEVVTNYTSDIDANGQLNLVDVVKLVELMYK